ncbi:DUF4270 family protein [Hugenholtzia roseola]|uniref:DUF4270 family protein n=1 Tax=Hugenholtzia roseola TaxID=1002 RepID=UPI0003F887CD|nr:DUF4270 family protein [Hugenholtzia roseola]
MIKSSKLVYFCVLNGSTDLLCSLVVLSYRFLVCILVEILPMKFTRVFFPFAWAALFLAAMSLFTACQDPDSLGLELEDPSDLINTVYTDTITIVSDIVKVDSINTTSASTSTAPFLVVGQMENEYFGKYEAKSYARMIIHENDIEFETAGEPYLLDSVLLRLYVSSVQGDRTTPHRLAVYRNLETLSPDSTFYQFDALQTEIQPIGYATFPDDLDSNNVLNFRMTEAFANELFSKGGAEELTNQEKFVEYFKGVSIRSDEETSNSIVSFDARNILSFLGVYYHLASSDTIPRVRRIANFGAHFCNFSSDLSRSAYLQNLSAAASIPTQSTDNIGMIQAGTGILTRLRFPHLTSFGRDQKVMINRAELALDPIPDYLGNVRSAPPFLYLYYGNAGSSDELFEFSAVTGQPLALMSETNSSQPLAFNYLSGGRAYSTIQLTAYIQRVIDGEIPNSGLILFPSGNTYSLHSVIFGDNKRAQNRLRLKVYYTIAP